MARTAVSKGQQRPDTSESEYDDCKEWDRE